MARITMNSRDFPVPALPFDSLRIGNQLASPSVVNVPSFPSCHNDDKTVLPPINRLPPEVLGDIFKAFLNAGERVLSNSCCMSVSGESSVAPFILGQVCWHWTNLVLAMPSLWSSISINIPKQSHIPLTKSWLSRAGECPIVFRLHQSMDPDDDENNATYEIFSILLCYSRRWREVDLCFPFGGVRFPVKSLTALSFPLLEAISLDILSTPDRNQVDQVWRRFHSAPRLQRLYWHSYNNELPCHAPWTQLIYLKLKHHIHVDVLLNGLKSCQALETLDVNVISALAPSSPLNSLTLEKLSHLNIVFHTGVHFVYDNLNLPSLTAMCIEHQYGVEQPLKCQAFKNFLERSSCQLKEFEFWDTCITRDEFHSYLEPTAMASVVKLTIASEVNDGIAHLLSPSSNYEIALLPQLKDIEFIYRCRNDALAAMAFSRFSNRACATLKTLIANGVIFDLHMSSIFDRLFHSATIH